jgi:hypothetical protein
MGRAAGRLSLGPRERGRRNLPHAEDAGSQADAPPGMFYKEWTMHDLLA